MVKPSVLLSDKDWGEIRVHFSSMVDFTLTRSMGNLAVTVTVGSADKAWPVAMLVGVRVKFGGRVDRQWFASVEVARKTLGEWEYR